MCYPKPGPRCAAHTLPILKEATKDCKEAHEAYQANPTPETESRKKLAEEERYFARLDYYGTPQGQKTIVAIMNDYESQGKEDSPAYQDMLSIWQKSVSIRAEQMRAHKAIMGEMNNMHVPTRSSDPLIRGKRLSMNSHSIKQSMDKGFDPETIRETFNNPERVYPNGRKYPGQVRITGNGICIVAAPNTRNSGSLTIVTVYLDDVTTPPREDQKNDADGRQYHERYAKHGASARRGLRGNYS